MAGLAGRTRAVFVGAIVIITAGVIAVVTLNDPEDAAEGVAATTAPPVSTTTSAIETSVELSGWAEEYIWSEFVEDDPGSDQTLVHRLVPNDVSDDGTIISGTLVQEGFQTYAVMDVLGVPGDGFVTIEFVAVTEGSEPYTEAEALFQLAGNPQRPETTVVGLVTLIPDPPAGKLFVRDVGEVVVAQPPATVWGVDAETFDLVKVEISSGAELRRVAGWGVDLAERSVGGGQARQFVEVEAGTSVWVDDCCQAALGPPSESISRRPASTT